MSNVNISPNMGLIIPTVDTDPGPDWANNLNASLTSVDSHNHSSGQGVQINPTGLNINSDLPFNINNATLLRSARFSPQTSPLSLITDINCLYDSGVDLYFNDGNGNQIRITESGSVAGASGTITGLPSGTAGASYSSGVFSFNATSSIFANLNIASLLLSNNVSSSKQLTLQPPNSMTSNYAITLPAPSSAGQTAILTYDTSNNIGSSLVPDNSSIEISSNVLQVKAGGITNSQLAPCNIVASGSSGSASTTSGSFVQVTNMSQTITTVGRPVMISFRSSGASSAGSIGCGGTSLWAIYRDGTQISETILSSVLESGPGQLNFIDGAPTAATHTYALYYRDSVGGDTVSMFNCLMILNEL
jgi:hypothetical protein